MIIVVGNGRGEYATIVDNRFPKASDEDGCEDGCEACDDTEGPFCEGCGCCAQCCNCTETDCDCDVCEDRRNG